MVRRAQVAREELTGRCALCRESQLLFPVLVFGLLLRSIVNVHPKKLGRQFKVVRSITVDKIHTFMVLTLISYNCL